MAVAMLSSAEVQALSNSLVTELGRTGRKAGKAGQRGGDAGAPLPPENATAIAASTTATSSHGHREGLPGNGCAPPARVLPHHSPDTPPTYLWPGTRRAPGGPR